MSFSLFQRGIPHEGKIFVGAGGMAVSNEFFSSSKRKSSRRKNPRGRGEGGGVTRENISKRYSIEVSMRFFSLSMRKPSHSFPLPQGNSPREDFLFDEEKTSWQLSRTAMSFSLRQRRNSHERKILLGVWGGGVESNEFFSSSKRKSSRGKNPRGRGGGYGGHKGEYLKMIFY